MTMRSNCLALLFLAVGVAACAPSNGTQMAAMSNNTFTIHLDGQQETPPVASGANGFATASLDRSTKTLYWNLSYKGLSSAATVAHFHGPAAPGVKAGVQVPVSIAPLNGETHGEAQLTDAQIAQLLAGQWYLNVHSQKYPDGEIRGQVVPATM
jgi:CHRD domain-containing protein